MCEQKGRSSLARSQSRHSFTSQETEAPELHFVSKETAHMKRTTTVLGVALLAMSSSVSLADKPEKSNEPAKSEKSTSATAVKPTKMTCEEFLALDEVSRPKVVYWAEGFDRKGKPEAVFDVETTDRVVPVVVEACKKAPTESFWKKVKEEFKKVF